jgi:hypothetical protein
MSRRSVTRSAISPPIVVKIVTNCSTAPCTAATGPCPACRFLATPERSPLSRASAALAVSTSAAAPCASAALAENVSATAAAASSYAASAASASAKSPSP